MSKKLAEKFFNNQTTPDENKVVLEWFETSEGKQILQERIEVDKELMERKDLRVAIPELDSEELFTSIQEEIRNKKKKFSLGRTDWVGYLMKVAAAVLVILTAVLFTIVHESYKVIQVAEREPVIFQTEEEQHREITLSDGSVVRLNENSEIVLSENFMREKRELRLTGEAYFDVAHNPNMPFVIHTAHASIEVLGTAFNVKTFLESDDLLVAVVNGKVNLRSSYVQSQNHEILGENMVGYFDSKKKEIISENTDVYNYLSWFNGRIVFDKTPFPDLIKQLERIYNINTKITSEKLLEFNLTANFEAKSLENVLEVVGHTLDIEYQKKNDLVSWKMKNHSHTSRDDCEYSNIN